MAGRKVQIVALVDPEIRTGLDTLRMISTASRARELENVLADALENALIEAGYQGSISRVEKLAQRAEMSVEDYVAAYAKAYARDTFGPGLDALEKDDRAVTGQKKKPAPIAA